MGVRVEVQNGESIADALRRLRRLVIAEGRPRVIRGKWHKKRYDFYVKPSQLRCRRQFLAALKKKGRSSCYLDPDWE